MIQQYRNVIGNLKGGYYKVRFMMSQEYKKFNWSVNYLGNFNKGNNKVKLIMTQEYRNVIGN